jgi:hypothetical protein
MWAPPVRALVPDWAPVPEQAQAPGRVPERVQAPAQARTRRSRL